MEKVNQKRKKSNDGVKNAVVKEINMNWPQHLTTLILSNKNIADFEENVVLPPNLMELDLSHNSFENIPSVVLNLAKIQRLDLSHNSIAYFNDTPCFCHSIQELNLSHNSLTGPPHWVWAESPESLVKINLSDNIKLTDSLNDNQEYFAELLEYNTSITQVILFNCRIREFTELIGTFPAAKTLELGVPDLSLSKKNEILQIPCKGLDRCCDVESLNLSNTKLYLIEPTIEMYKNLIEINLSYNEISSIPNQFCNLENLEICILSSNDLIYLPDNMANLKRLVCSKIDSNKLCMLPGNLCMLPYLKILDLYDNALYEVANELMKIEEIDFAQNYFEEPESEEYLQKKEKLRLNITERLDGRKPEEVNESEYSSEVNAEDLYDDDEYLNEAVNVEPQPQENQQNEYSSEDWDSDEYWEPNCSRSNASANDRWMHFSRAKMQEGNFCPMDLHEEPIMELVKREQQSNPKQWAVVPGQFDEYYDEHS